MLPFFAVILFAVMGIAALTIDAGLAFTTQAQIESTGRTLALEYERFRLEAATDPTVDLADWPERARALEIDLLGPDAQTASWEVDAAGVTRGETPLESRFAFGALLPQAVGPDGRLADGLSVTDLLDARASGDPNATTTTGGLRANGFRPQTALTVRPRLVARVGAAQSFVDASGNPRRIPGIAGIALTEQAYRNGWFSGRSITTNRATLEAQPSATDGETRCIGWTIADETAAVGTVLTPVTRGGWDLDATQGYVPVVRGNPDGDGDCSEAPRVVAFLNLRRVGAEIDFSDVTTARNASAVPAPGSGAAIDTDSWRCGLVGALCVPALDVASVTP